MARGVRWLGASARVASFSSERTAHGYRNTLLLTDARSRASLPFRDVGPEASPMLGIRAAPSGRYLLLLLRSAPSEIWTVGGEARPARIRVLDLPFTAVEWVLPRGAAPREPLGAERWLTLERSPLARERSFFGAWDLDGADAPAEGPSEADLEPPEERFAFALSDGRVGVLAVRGRKVSDAKPVRPAWGSLAAGAEGVATAIAAWGSLVVMGDADGNLNRWDTATGRMSTLATTYGAVRRILFAPPAAEALVRGAPGAAAAAALARVSVLFANGTFGVWELDANMELRQGAVTVAASSALGRVVDLAWAPLPAPVGGGSVAVVATEDGCLALVDAAQTREARSRRRRLAAFRQLVGGHWPFPQAGLSPPPPVGSSLLLPPAWAALLRLLLQAGVSTGVLRALAGPPGEGDAALEEAVWERLPHAARDSWAAHPRRLGTTEVEELSALAGESGMQRTTSADVHGGAPRPHAEEWSAQINTFSTSASLPPPPMLPVWSRGSGDGGAATPDASPVPGPGPSEWSPMTPGGNAGPSTRLSGPRERAVRSGFPRGGGPAAEAARQVASIPEEEPLAPPGGPANGDSPAPGGGTSAELGRVLRALARTRAGGGLLHPLEWAAYEQALGLGSTAARMAAAAAAMGDAAEARFWRGLPATLAALREALPAAELAEARERVLWHEAMSRGSGPSAEHMQELRVIEYVALGDYETAVGHLLASAPEKSARYYRDALCTLALAAASAEAPEAVKAGEHEQVSRTLHIQAAKVVAAHAASIGDALLAVPLLCSAGLPNEAVAALQEAGLWRYASTLAAHQLSGNERAAALERWAAHIHQAAGDLWRALGVLVAGGALRTAVLTLRRLGLPDTAAAFAAACGEAGLRNARAPVDAGGLENLLHHTGNTPVRSQSLATPLPPADAAAAREAPTDSLDADFARYCCHVLQQL
ncbi:hypothetical protein WJX81_003317 [Elliptochloris bilobata]|uniref:Uncharacterized protein n=1 Tax=Elliptochloris bilobata TaxID=381761 RepID=A0AAW1SII8_9CHLO